MAKIGRIGLPAAVAIFLVAGACSSKDPIGTSQGGTGGGGGTSPAGTGGCCDGFGGQFPGTGGSGTGGYIYGDGGASGIGGRIGIGGAMGFGGQIYGFGGYIYGYGGEIVPGVGGYIYGVGGASGTGGFVEGGVGGAPIGTGGAPGTNCMQVATQADCDMHSDCYSVFFDPQTCGCAGAGCCEHFDHCANSNGGAQCYGGVSCAVATPFCDGAYVVAYRNGCYEGCVNGADCAPVCTPGVDQTCNDNPIVSSLHGHCTDAGMCQCGSGFILNPNTGRCL